MEAGVHAEPANSSGQYSEGAGTSDYIEVESGLGVLLPALGLIQEEEFDLFFFIVGEHCLIIMWY